MVDIRKLYNYYGPQNLDSVLSYTWEENEGGPSGEFKEKAHTVIKADLPELILI
jgi:hypothetical protein